MKTNSNLIRTACLLAFTGATAWAQAGISDAAYNNAKEQLKAAYKVERDACNTQAGNAKDICVETAKGREKVALAHLQVQHTGAQKDMVKRVVEHDVSTVVHHREAPERIETKSGAARDVADFFQRIESREWQPENRSRFCRRVRGSRHKPAGDGDQHAVDDDIQHRERRAAVAGTRPGDRIHCE